MRIISRHDDGKFQLLGDCRELYRGATIFAQTMSASGTVAAFNQSREASPVVILRRAHRRLAGETKEVGPKHRTKG